jgi:hypothetical protein
MPLYGFKEGGHGSTFAKKRPGPSRKHDGVVFQGHFYSWDELSVTPNEKVKREVKKASEEEPKQEKKNALTPAADPRAPRYFAVEGRWAWHTWDATAGGFVNTDTPTPSAKGSAWTRPGRTAGAAWTKKKWRAVVSSETPTGVGASSASPSVPACVPFPGYGSAPNALRGAG